jgi:hypothetical protein
MHGSGTLFIQTHVASQNFVKVAMRTVEVANVIITDSHALLNQASLHLHK